MGGGDVFISCFFTFYLVPLSSQSFSFISFTISSISFFPFSGKRHRMTHKGRCVVKPQNNQLTNMVYVLDPNNSVIKRLWCIGHLNSIYLS